MLTCTTGNLESTQKEDLVPSASTERQSEETLLRACRMRSVWLLSSGDDEIDRAQGLR